MLGESGSPGGMILHVPFCDVTHAWLRCMYMTKSVWHIVLKLALSICYSGVFDYLQCTLRVFSWQKSGFVSLLCECLAAFSNLLWGQLPLQRSHQWWNSSQVQRSLTQSKGVNSIAIKRCELFMGNKGCGHFGQLIRYSGQCLLRGWTSLLSCALPSGTNGVQETKAVGKCGDCKTLSATVKLISGRHWIRGNFLANPRENLISFPGKWWILRQMLVEECFVTCLRAMHLMELPMQSHTPIWVTVDGYWAISKISNSFGLYYWCTEI